ncbi:type II secretion system protein GspC [Bdellovibrio reynosensis]|uniref:PDZ domain-containing protein n=1 Tax=Bdellovibrio reynosensis TaxID=2835041 RepID=A0ABY4CBV7_9BACT|nr:type II secretion system protein GspC [Bdellovibrio reynosensis]UOF02328.1 PDZ domain-containing protein [Bdellovibrio reynosensis]
MIFSNSRNSKNQRPPFEKWYSYLLFVFIGYCIADLAILAYRDRMLPQSAPAARPKAPPIDTSVNRGAYNSITSRNMFASNGEIPDPLVDKTKGPEAQKEQVPVPSQLPLNLIGTLVHSNPDKSLAAIEVRGKNQVISYTPGKEIEGMASIVRVERQKVIFRNLNSNRMEYIEMKKDGNKVAFGASAVSAGGKEVQKAGDNNFVIKRADLLKYTNDLSSVLMQARAVPNREPGTGNINGFRLLDMQPGSIYEQLGLQRMDVIKSVDGTPVDSPAKAMELYNSLKNSPKVTLQVERNGKNETMTYNIQ